MALRKHRACGVWGRENEKSMRALLKLQAGLQCQTPQSKLIALWSCRPEDTGAQDWKVTLVLQTALWTPAARGQSCMAGGALALAKHLYTEERAGWRPQLSKDKGSPKPEQPLGPCSSSICSVKRGWWHLFCINSLLGYCNTVFSVSCRQVLSLNIDFKKQ